MTRRVNNEINPIVRETIGSLAPDSPPSDESEQATRPQINEGQSLPQRKEGEIEVVLGRSSRIEREHCVGYFPEDAIVKLRQIALGEVCATEQINLVIEALLDEGVDPLAIIQYFFWQIFLGNEVDVKARAQIEHLVIEHLHTVVEEKKTGPHGQPSAGNIEVLDALSPLILTRINSEIISVELFGLFFQLLQLNYTFQDILNQLDLLFQRTGELSDNQKKQITDALDLAFVCFLF